MIDSHCHLANPQFDNDLAAVLDRAKAAGVERMVTIADSLLEAERCIALAEKYPRLYATVGIHPHHSDQWSAISGQQIRNLVASSTKVKAIGEIGLDYHYMNAPIDVQCAAFASQWTLAKDLGLPAVVHCREAVEDVWAIVRESDLPKVVLHCCTEKWEDAEMFVAAGHFLSFTGIATYPTADAIRRTIRECPLDRIMIETDSPYLAPTLHRWKRNEPAFVTEVAEIIAKEKRLPVEEVAAATTRNAVAFFGLDAVE